MHRRFRGLGCGLVPTTKGGFYDRISYGFSSPPYCDDCHREILFWLDGKIAPGPDYRLYLTPKYVETGAGFRNIKALSIQILPVKAFENFSLNLPDGVEATNYRAVLMWCEAFEQFIIAAELR